MSYTTQAELTARYGADRMIELTDRATPPAGAIDATVLTRAIADADATIDAYVGKHYTLPFATVPELLKRIAQALVFHSLHIDSVSEKVKADYDQAMRQLEWIATGKLKLADAAGAEPTVSSGAPAYTSADRVDLTGFNS
jgi:phage gp36-like protein